MTEIVGTQLPRVISIEASASASLTEGAAKARGRQASTA
jgi:hypothetical protein